MNDDIWKDLDELSKNCQVNFSSMFNCVNFSIKDNNIYLNKFTFTLEEFVDLVYYYKDKNRRLYQFLKSKYPEYFI